MDRITIKATSLHYFLIEFLQSDSDLSKVINSSVKSLMSEYGRGMFILSSLELLNINLVESVKYTESKDVVFETALNNFNIIFVSRDTYAYDKWLRFLIYNF